MAVGGAHFNTGFPGQAAGIGMHKLVLRIKTHRKAGMQLLHKLFGRGGGYGIGYAFYQVFLDKHGGLLVGPGRNLKRGVRHAIRIYTLRGMITRLLRTGVVVARHVS